MTFLKFMLLAVLFLAALLAAGCAFLFFWAGELRDCLIAAAVIVVAAFCAYRIARHIP